MTLVIVCLAGGGHEIAGATTPVGKGHCNQGVTFGFYGGVQVIVGDLRYDHVPFRIPGQHCLGKAEAGAERGQEFDYLGRDRGLLIDAVCVTEIWLLFAANIQDARVGAKDQFLFLLEGGKPTESKSQV